MLLLMSMVSDAMRHTVLPDAAIGFLIVGNLSLPAMELGGLVAGLSVARVPGVVTRTPSVNENARFARSYLTSLALGGVIVLRRGSNLGLLHILSGTILAIDAQALYLFGAIASFTLIKLSLVYRRWWPRASSPFLAREWGFGSVYHVIFPFLVVFNLVASVQYLGTLMAVGLMMMPFGVAQIWSRSRVGMFLISAVTAAGSGFGGLLISYYLRLTSKPTLSLTLKRLILRRANSIALTLAFQPHLVQKRLMASPVLPFLRTL